MATIEQRFKQIAYKNVKFPNKDLIPKSEDSLFLISEELKKEDFKEPFFKGVIFLGDGFKFLSYCGKDQQKNLNKNALVIQKKLSKGDKVIYRVYLMDKDGFNIRSLFNSSEFKNNKKPCEENGFRLDAGFYCSGGLKESYEKEELIYIINQIQNKLIDWSLKQR